MRLNEKLYEDLKPKERFKVALNAQARCDREEIARIKKTCPCRTYRMLDSEFVNLMTNSEDLTNTFAILFHSYLTDYLFAKVYYYDVKKNISCDEKSDYPPEIMKEVKMSFKAQALALSRLKSTCDSFFEFCQANDIDAQTLIAAYCAPTNRRTVENMANFVSTYERDNETYEILQKVWKKCWGLTY